MTAVLRKAIAVLEMRIFYLLVEKYAAATIFSRP